MKKVFAVLFFMSFLISESSAADSVSGDVIVVLRNDSGVRINSVKTSGGVKSLSAVKSFAASQNVKVVETFDSLSDKSDKIFMVVHSDTENENELLRKIKARPDVISASLNHKYTLNLPETPNDSDYFRLWGMEAINAPKAWSISTGSDDVYVAVVDSGIDYNHPDLKDNFSHEYSKNFLGHAGANYDPSAYYDERGHGTHVAGTIAGVGNNAQGVAGVNWRAKIFSVRVLNKNGSGTDADIIAAFNYISGLLAKDSKLNLAAVNFSVGGYITDSPEKLIANNDPLWLALKMLSDTGRTLICAAAGNENNDIGRPTPSTTSDWDKGSCNLIASYLELGSMITVAAADSSFRRASFSNYSNKYVDIAAPGVSIFSTYPLTLSNDTGYAVLPRVYPYASNSGTSMAAPHVAGSAALLKAIYPNATASQIKAAILGGANGDYCRDDKYGTSAHGMLDLTGAINFMAAVMSDDIPPKISGANPPAGVVSQRYKTEFYAAGTQPVTWTVDGALPEGLTFSDGKISGTPTESGTFPFTVTASNKNGSSSLVMSLVVNDAEAPVIDASTVSFDTLASSDCKATLMTSSGTWPMIWSIESGDVPADFRLRVNKDSGVLRFTAKTAGTYTFPVKVSNDAGNDTAEFTLKVREAEAPEIKYDSDDKLGNATLGRAYKSYIVSSASGIYTSIINSRITAKGTRPISWDIQNLPKGLSFTQTNSDTDSESTARITGRPEESGDFMLRVTASNAIGVSSLDIPLKVEDTKPEFIDEGIALFLQKGIEINTEISRPLPVKGSAPITFTTSGNLPAGMKIRYEDNTPIFYGKAASTGRYTFTIKAENSCGSDEAALDFSIIEPSAIITHVLPDAVKGVSYDAKINLRSDVSMNWTISADKSLNLKISQSGNITGLPSETGQFTVAVNTSSPDVYEDNKTYSLNVYSLPVIKTSSLPNGKINTEYAKTVLTAEGVPDPLWTVSEGKMPEGLSLSQNGHVYGTPKESGTFIFTLEAGNKAGHDTRTFTLNITGSTTPTTPQSGDVPSTPESHDIPPAPESHDTPAPKTVIISEGKPRDISSLTIGELASITNADGVIAAILPEISTNLEGFYTSESIDCFANVKISADVPAGWTLVWNPFARTTSSALSVKDAADDNVQFTDSDGHITITVPENHIVNVSAWLDADTLYAPVISATEHKEDPEGVPSASSGGCNFFSLSLALIAPLLFVKMRKL